MDHFREGTGANETAGRQGIPFRHVLAFLMRRLLITRMMPEPDADIPKINEAAEILSHACAIRGGERRDFTPERLEYPQKKPAFSQYKRMPPGKRYSGFAYRSGKRMHNGSAPFAKFEKRCTLPKFMVEIPGNTAVFMPERLKQSIATRNGERSQQETTVVQIRPRQENRQQRRRFSLRKRSHKVQFLGDPQGKSRFKALEGRCFGGHQLKPVRPCVPAFKKKRLYTAQAISGERSVLVTLKKRSGSGS
jgi:hypothetical protein